MLRLAGITEESVVDGPGIRMVIYAQGCPHHCEGCHNPSTWSYDGELVSVDSLINLIASNHVLNGITISGGEPFEQDEAFARLAKQVRELGLTVVVYTGYTLEQIEGSPLLDHVDYLVDGPYVASLPSLPWRGSSNQRILCKRDGLWIQAVDTLPSIDIMTAL